jgi:hypothetical protein
MVVLQNERSASDAEMFPEAFSNPEMSLESRFDSNTR